MKALSRASGPGIFRLYLATAVVLFHLGLWGNIGTWGVYLFFVLSGFWISRLWRTKYRRCPRRYLVFMVSRYWRLLPVYATCTLLMLFCLWKYLGTFQSWNPYFASLPWRISTFAILGIAGRPSLLIPAWSLDIEMQFYLLAPLLLGLIVFCFTPPFARAKVAALLLACSVAFWWMPLCLHVTPYLIFFVAGCAIDIGDWRPSRSLAITSAVAVMAALVIVLFFPVTSGGIANGAFPEDHQTDRAIWWGKPFDIVRAEGEGDPGRWIAILFIAAAAPYIAYCLQKKSDKLDRALGDLAYPIYLFHPIPLIMVWRFRHFRGLPFQPVVLPVLFLLITAAGSLVIYLLIDRPLDRLRRGFIEGHRGRACKTRDGPTSECPGSLCKGCSRCKYIGVRISGPLEQSGEFKTSGASNRTGK